MTSSEAKDKGKKPAAKVWPYVVVPLIALMVIGWMVWRLLQPGIVPTSEGMEILRTQEIQTAVLNDGTQQVNLVLQEPYTHESTAVEDPTKDLGKNITFTYARAQTDEILGLIEKADPPKGYNAMYPQTSVLGGMLQLMLPMILILTGVIGGLIAFGMIGLFIGPVLLAVSWRLYDAWVHEVPPPPKDPDVVLEELSELEAGRK